MNDEKLSMRSDEDFFQLCGSLTFANTALLMPKASSYFSDLVTDTVVIDLSKVNKIDSAGIALLLAWKRWAVEHNKKFQVRAAQEQAISLIKTNKLDTLLNISA